MSQSEVGPFAMKGNEPDADGQLAVITTEPNELMVETIGHDGMPAIIKATGLTPLGMSPAIQISHQFTGRRRYSPAGSDELAASYERRFHCQCQHSYEPLQVGAT